jgi:hypothetical protein
MASGLVMVDSESRPNLNFASGGFELFVPPVPFSQPPNPACFVMLDDQHDIFYEVDYQSADLRNTTEWTTVELHSVQDPAIVFPPLQWEKLGNDMNEKITGFVVDVKSRDDECWIAEKLGAVHVRRFPQEYMNWSALASLKGSELPEEMKAGLLRNVFNRRVNPEEYTISYVTLRRVLDNMKRPWHQDGAALNWELNERFVGAKRIESGQKWKLYASED